jgi:hypothetical protein
MEPGGTSCNGIMCPPGKFGPAGTCKPRLIPVFLSWTLLLSHTCSATQWGVTKPSLSHYKHIEKWSVPSFKVHFTSLSRRENSVRIFSVLTRLVVILRLHCSTDKKNLLSSFFFVAALALPQLCSLIFKSSRIVDQGIRGDMQTTCRCPVLPGCCLLLLSKRYLLYYCR